MNPLRSRRLPALLFVGLTVFTATPDASATPSPAAVNPSSHRRFVAELARAERTHDYRSLLTECDLHVVAHPQDHEVYRRRALVRWGARQDESALADFARAVELARAHRASAHVLGMLYYGRALVRREQHDTAAEAGELERVGLTDARFADAFNDLAWIRATNPDPTLRNGRQAVTLAKHACGIVSGSVKYLDTLAAAYAEAGDARRAADTEKAAIKAANTDAHAADRHHDFLAGAFSRVQLYAAGERYRDRTGNALEAAGKVRPDS